MTIIELNVAGYHGTLRVDFTRKGMKRVFIPGWWRRLPADGAEDLREPAA